MLDWNNMKDMGQRMKVKRENDFVLNTTRAMYLTDIGRNDSENIILER